MYKPFTSLKTHYGMETMLEVFFDETLRKDLFDKPLYRNGEEVCMFFGREEGLYARDFGSCGLVIKKRVDEEYLESLVMRSEDYYAITGNMCTDGVVLDMKAILEEAKQFDVEAKVSAIKATAVLVIGAIALAAVHVSNMKSPTPPVSPKSKPNSKK